MILYFGTLPQENFHFSASYFVLPHIQTFQLITPLSCFIGFRGVRLGRLLFFLHLFNTRFAGAVFLYTH